MGQKHSLAEVGKQKMLLEERLTEANAGIDRLTQEYVTLRETNRRLNEQLSTFERLKTRYDAFKETATSLKGQVKAIFSEAQDLKQEKEKLMKQIEDLLGELEARKLVVSTKFNAILMYNLSLSQILFINLPIYVGNRCQRCFDRRSKSY